MIVVDNMILYYKLDSLLENKGIKKIDLQRKLGISPSTMANFSKNKFVEMSIIDKICQVILCHMLMNHKQKKQKLKLK